MAWRPPKVLLVRGRTVEVRQVPMAELQDIAADHDDEVLDGAWREDTMTIYLHHALSPAAKNEAYWHEVQHMLVDLLGAP